ncbi:MULTISPECIES: PAS domain-containing sensor histidine kinase [unclassified Clostridium]|uniref:sensor histidine kinase n=1 Tax=unclassified Clostridium TaxID=2614128 RepID=UPI000297599E|nr:MULTISPECIES: PAS domain-containing sensor histidine kinase [unclassified Clostridium]EKQ55992.1 MAG: PAS domain S-box [Clostridium sp. Maddingley MBC34-26]
MKIFINKTENNLSIILSIVKIAIIVFISIIIYMNLPKYWANLNIKDNGQFNLYTTGFFLCTTGICYIIWLIISNRISQSSNVFRISWLLENIFFISIISLPIYLSTVYENEYKYLFLLLIISSVIQYGSRYGIITSLFSSIFILGADLLYAPLNDGINVYFQKDLIMAGIFIFFAWILGYYVDMEFENNKKKDETLNILSCELEEKDKQRKEMESLLLNNKICYDMLFENSLNSIIVHKDGIIIYANESASKLLGYKNPMDLNGETFYNHYLDGFQRNIENKYLEIVDKKLLKIIEDENIINYNGEVIPVRNTSSFFTYRGEPSILTFLLDITSEKKVETLELDAEKNLKLLNETREFNSLIMDFFTNMSHELKTPVNVIYVAIQAINMHLDNYDLYSIDKCKSYLKTMKQNCKRMIRLINNLLDITKLDSGFIKINKKNGNIVSVVEDIVQSVASYVKSRDIELIFDTEIEEKIMSFDHDMIERIMLNLISNAFKYSHPRGHIYVDLLDNESSIIIKVKDEGDGIPPNKLDVIFERFGQANSSLSRQCEGTGIGLYLVKSFIEMHNGKISVVSTEGEGSEFSIELPVLPVEDEDYMNNMLFETNVERIEIEFSDIYSIQD